jgi:hypothetical protein
MLIEHWDHLASKSWSAAHHEGPLGNSALIANVAQGGAGGTGGNGLGGGAYNDTFTTLTVTYSTVTLNDADGRQGKHGGTDGEGIGGGVYNLGTFTFDVFTVIKGNHASTSNDNIFP